MKLSRLPIWLILLGSTLLTLFFGWMLFQALHNDREAFVRDLHFQSQEQGITVSASRAGLERRVRLLATTLVADPVVRGLMLQASNPNPPEKLQAIRARLRDALSPYWESLQDGNALELNLFRLIDSEANPFLSFESVGAGPTTYGDSDYLLRQSLMTRKPVQGIEFDGLRASTAGIAPIFGPEDEKNDTLVGLLEVEFAVVPNVGKLSEQLDSGVAILSRQKGEQQGASSWRVAESSRTLIGGWLSQQKTPDALEQPDWTVVKGSGGRGYLLTLVPLSPSGDETMLTVAAIAVWKDITALLEHRDALVINTWLRWGVAWLIAEACLLLLLWGTRRATRHAMLESHRRLNNQKEALQTLNDIAALQQTSFLELVDHALEAGCRFLGMPFGIVSHIEDGIYHVESAHSPGGILKRGQTFDVRETFCEFTLQADDVVAFANADEAGHGEHPCRVVHEFKGYVGAPIWVNGQRYGTLGFSSDTVRERSFDEAEQEFVRLMARWVGATLSRWKEIEAREELSQRLSKIASQTPGLIYQYRQGPDGRPSFPYASDAIKTFYGITPEEAAEDASQVFERVHEDDAERLAISVNESARNLTPWNCEYRVRQDNGEFIWLAGQSIPEREADGGTIWHGFLHDVTARKRDERLKSEFISTVSHELRTPLTSISGALGLIQGGALGVPPDTMRGMLATAHNNSQRLIMLINDLLDMEKLVAGKMAFQMQEQRLMPLIDQAIESNQAYADQFQARYVVTERMDRVGVNVDAMRLQQVMSNLLSNAAKFTPPNTQVEIRVEPIADRVRVSVIDNGPGIPAEFHDRIFQKFSQADASTTRKQGGTGLGLAITRELVERMRGSINFFSEAGQGACFFFELPCIELPEDLEEIASPAPVALTGAPVESVADGSRLLIVEDDHDTAVLLATLVRHWGYEAEIAHSMGDALRWLERRSFDAITLDLMLPDGNGLTLLRQLREQPQTRELPVLVVSAKAEEGQLEIGGRLDAVDWLAKPFDEKRLAGALHSSLSLRPERARILHVESDAKLSQRIAAQIAPSMTLDVARSLQEARYLLDSYDYGLISLDLTASYGPGWEVIPMLSQLARQPAVIMLSEEALAPTLLGRVETAIAKPGLSAEALMGAFDRQLRGSKTLSSADQRDDRQGDKEEND
ncbi:ATP-binding protein [Salinicola halimionae]|uniref:ATP-binding protein n=1 Tax=Salinicola halimionae TaxID=1949081 RepID=UPI000DA238B6|nr:ATP-binding protein [Salinicola halimionae]